MASHPQRALVIRERPAGYVIEDLLVRRLGEVDPVPVHMLRWIRARFPDQHFLPVLDDLRPAPVVLVVVVLPAVTTASPQRLRESCNTYTHP